MRVVHRLEITAVCPVDDKPDVYACEVHANRVIKVEDILREAQIVASLKVFQEEICQHLHRALACKVVLTGYHSGVLTEVTCG